MTAKSCLWCNSRQRNPATPLVPHLASHVLVPGVPMSDISVTRHEKGAWAQDVVEALDRVLGQGGSTGRPALEQELLRCDLLYLAHDAEGPKAFLFVARVRLPVGPERREARYLGLSVAWDEERGASVLERFAEDARDEEQSRLRCLVPVTT